MGKAFEHMAVLDLVDRELYRAELKFPKFNSAHEGFAIIQEEFVELWEEITPQHEKRSLEKMRTEAIQLAAMATRFIIDICPPERGE